MPGPKNLKPLVITTDRVQAAGSEFAWNKLQGLETFIAAITTPQVNTESSEELNRLVSGIPTPFARPAMFRYAINHAGHDSSDGGGLIAFYRTLQDEWKGLVACLALDNEPLSVERVDLAYSDGRPADETGNLYEPKGALGSMLFDDGELWCDQRDHGDATRPTVPFIDIIRYDGVVIGGTSPESLLFTPPVYELPVERAFYSTITRKFTDPLRSTLSRDEVEKLHVYVQHLLRSMDGYVARFTRRKPDVLRVARFLTHWTQEIEAYASGLGYSIDPKAIPPNLDRFGPPFDSLFNCQTTLYGYAGRIAADTASLHLPEGTDAIEVDLPGLLLDAAAATIAEILPDDPAQAASMPVHLLRVPADDGDRYFSLPLSERGLAIFQDDIGALLEGGGEMASSLSGLYDVGTRTLQVTLKVDVAGSVTSVTRHYREPVMIEGQRVICWPDFVSPIWMRYYLYSELPHNGTDLRAFPLRADRDTFRLVGEPGAPGFRLRRIAENGTVAPDDSAKLLVRYDIDRISSSELKYEIYESHEPFKGIALTFRNRPAGYVLFRSLVSGRGLKDFRSRNRQLNEARVGFDFGSNNICVSHADVGADGKPGKPQLLTFTNRRRSILGADTAGHGGIAVSPSEVFFFQDEEVKGNQVKSMLMAHDERRIAGFDVDPVDTLTQVVKGGFPVFEANLLVEESTDTTHTVRLAGQAAYIKHNMKWSSDRKQNAYKEGLLEMLWLMAYAELLEQEKFPVALVWAYPSAMSRQQLLPYGTLWRDVGELNPLMAVPGTGREYPNAVVAQYSVRAGSGAGQSGDDRPVALTEAVAVCRYALGAGEFQADSRSLIIGCDVGGSTTDILCIVNRKATGAAGDEFRDTLVKQGSIRVAAGVLADATRKLPGFPDALRAFCLKKKMQIHGITVPPITLSGNTAPYYYNVVVDRLQTREDLEEFYRNIGAECGALFTLNAYMTGLILFYAGQLARAIRQAQDQEPDRYHGPFENVRIGCFGKGGRMFDWLPSLDQGGGGASDYFAECFRAGYGPDAGNHIKLFRVEASEFEHAKAEVSFGLAGANTVETTGDQIAELIGEDGYTYDGQPVSETDPVQSKFLMHFGNQFATPREFRRFREFATIFRRFSSEYFGVGLPGMDEDISNMLLKSYISNLPEYQLAKASQDFDFEAPIIVLQGMCFLDTVLAPRLFRS